MYTFTEFAEDLERVEGIPGSLEMTEVVAELLQQAEDEELAVATRFIMGRVFPAWSALDMGVGPSLLYEAIARAAGITTDDVKDLVRETGDVGRAAEEALNGDGAKPTTFAAFTEEKEISLVDVYHVLERVAKASGKGSQATKIREIQYLFTSLEPRDVRYLARLILEELRIGVGEGIARDAIARASSVDVDLVERAYMLTNDLGRVALTARREGEKGLMELDIELGRPVKMMMAQAGTLEDLEGEWAVEWKYDGARLQIHKDDEVIKVYSRRLEDVTDSLPDVVRVVREHVNTPHVILDGEAVATGPNGKPLPFQEILKRLRRKYDVEEMVEEIPLALHLFDVLYKEEGLIDLPLRERHEVLTKVLDGEPGKIRIADQMITSDLDMISRVYDEALDAGHEGVLVKRPDSPYTPGKRGKNWLKIKPQAETLDLVVTGAEWGEGKRAHWLGSYSIACLDEEHGEYLGLGRVGTGLTDEQLESLTETFKPLVEAQRGKEVDLVPEVVFEIGYEEIQKSPNYESGYALRFPRLIRVRTDKSPEEADTLGRVANLYKEQRG